MTRKRLLLNPEQEAAKVERSLSAVVKRLAQGLVLFDTTVFHQTDPYGRDIVQQFRKAERVYDIPIGLLKFETHYIESLITLFQREHPPFVVPGVEREFGDKVHIIEKRTISLQHTEREKQQRHSLRSERLIGPSEKLEDLEKNIHQYLLALHHLSTALTHHIYSPAHEDRSLIDILRIIDEREWTGIADVDKRVVASAFSFALHTHQDVAVVSNDTDIRHLTQFLWHVFDAAAETMHIPEATLYPHRGIILYRNTLSRKGVKVAGRYHPFLRINYPPGNELTHCSPHHTLGQEDEPLIERAKEVLEHLVAPHEPALTGA